MKDKIDLFLSWIAHNRATAMAAAAILALTAVSCTALSVKKPSPPALSSDWRTAPQPLLTTAERVTVDEYDRRVLALELEFSNAYSDITNQVTRLTTVRNQAAKIIEHDAASYDRRLAIIDQVVSTVGGLATTAATGGISPTGLASVGLGLAGLLFGYGRHKDAARKDAVITQLKSGPSN